MILFSVFLLMAGCRTKEYVEVERIVSDSVFATYIDTVTVRMRVVDYSYALPVVDMRRETKDTVSVLEDSLYRSVAIVSNGTLSHILSTLPGARINVPVNVADTTVAKHGEVTAVKREVVEIPVPVERELGWWERTKIDLFFPVLMIAVIAVMYIVVWIIRRRE